MYLSIKWKALLLLSFILFTMSASWLYVAINKDLKNFQQDIYQQIQQQSTILDELKKDGFKQLSEYANLLINSPEIKLQQPVIANSKIQQFIDKNAFYWRLNLDMDFLIILNNKNQILGETHLFTDSEFGYLKQSVFPYLSSAFIEPQYKIFCSTSCIQTVIQPFKFSDGEAGVIIYGQNMSELVSRYAYLSLSDIAIFISPHAEFNSSKKNTKLNFIDDQKQQWKLWAMSNYESMQAVINQYPKHADSAQFDIFELMTKQYFYERLHKESANHIGAPTMYLSLFSAKDRVEILKSQFFQNLQSAFLVFILAEILLVLLLLGPLRKIRRLAAIYQNLPNGDYQKAIELVSHSPGFFKDEFSSIEKSALQLVKNLKGASAEMELNQNELMERLQVLTSSQDHLHRLFNHSSLLIVMLDESLQISSSNDSFNKLFNYPEEGEAWSALIRNSELEMEIEQRITDVFNRQISEYQQSILMVSNTSTPIGVFWNFSISINQQGEQRILAIGIPVSNHVDDVNKTAQPLKNDFHYSKKRSLGDINITTLDDTSIRDLNLILQKVKQVKSYENLTDQQQRILVERLEVALLNNAYEIKLIPQLAVNHLVVAQYQLDIIFDCYPLATLDLRSTILLLGNKPVFNEFYKKALRSVYRKLSDQIRKSPDVKLILSLPLSSIELKSFMDVIESLDEKYAFPFNSINFEVSGVFALMQQNSIQNNLRRLRQTGHEIDLHLYSVEGQISDYILLLQRIIDNSYEIDRLILPPFFWKACMTNEAYNQKLSYLVRDAQSSGIQLSAEGVSVIKDFELLKEIGIYYIQGELVGLGAEEQLTTDEIIAIQSKLIA